MSKFCPECGADQPDHAQLCLNCFYWFGDKCGDCAHFDPRRPLEIRCDLNDPERIIISGKTPACKDFKEVPRKPKFIFHK